MLVDGLRLSATVFEFLPVAAWARTASRRRSFVLAALAVQSRLDEAQPGDFVHKGTA